MFTFGTNDFGREFCRYNNDYDGCSCTCELLVHSNGTCKKGLLGFPGYRLYKLKEGKINVINIELISKRKFANRNYHYKSF